MPDFLVRVQLQSLQDNSFELYEQLHAAMAKTGFARTIRGSAGRWCLPDATYVGTFELTSAQVRDKAVEALRTTQKTGKVMVVQYTQAAWTGLDKA